MSKGEFEKRMQKQFLSNRYSQMTDLYPILDVARKDFPEGKMITAKDGFPFLCYEMKDVDEWFLKWFGDDK